MKVREYRFGLLGVQAEIPVGIHFDFVIRTEAVRIVAKIDAVIINFVLPLVISTRYIRIRLQRELRLPPVLNGDFVAAKQVIIHNIPSPHPLPPQVLLPISILCPSC